jgi:hypothetical protein
MRKSERIQLRLISITTSRAAPFSPQPTILGAVTVARIIAGIVLICFLAERFLKAVGSSRLPLLAQDFIV